MYIERGIVMTVIMDKQTKNLMDHIQKTSFYKPSAKDEVKKFVDEGGMEKQVLVDGVYRDKEDIDGSKDRKRKRISIAFWIGLVIVLLVGAVVLGVMMENGILDSSVEPVR